MKGCQNAPYNFALSAYPIKNFNQSLRLFRDTSNNFTKNPVHSKFYLNSDNKNFNKTTRDLKRPPPVVVFPRLGHYAS
jgi:hypothetical protein